MTNTTIIGAFSEEDACRLSGASRAQLRHWHRTGLLKASLGPQGSSGAYQRIYGFQDLVALRVLGVLRNEYGVSLQHLRDVAARLGSMGPKRWTTTTLYVLGKRVVFDDPRYGERREVVSGQRVFDIPMKAAISDTREAIKEYNRRGENERGVIVRRRFLQGNEPVFAKTRIPISVVDEYLDRGMSVDDVLTDFPDLTEEDVRYVQRRRGVSAA